MKTLLYVISIAISFFSCQNLYSQNYPKENVRLESDIWFGLNAQISLKSKNDLTIDSDSTLFYPSLGTKNIFLIQVLGQHSTMEMTDVDYFYQKSVYISYERLLSQKWIGGASFRYCELNVNKTTLRGHLRHYSSIKKIDLTFWQQVAIERIVSNNSFYDPVSRLRFQFAANKYFSISKNNPQKKLIGTLSFELFKEIQKIQSRLDGLKSYLSEDKLSNDQKKNIVLEMANLREDMLRTSQGMQVIEIGLRVEMITLEPFTMDSSEVVRIGLDNRLDLMNQRGFVMDARRLMEVRSNSLEAVLNVVVDGDVSTPLGQNKPLDFSSSRAGFRAGVEFTAPLSLVQERNAYRESQIDYQRQRRTFMAAEDATKFEVRRSWRQLTVLRQNFETSRVQIRLAALQYDNAVESTSDPKKAGGNQGNTQGLNLLNALRTVLTAQNSLISNWVNYEQNRLNIYRDMGIMEIDENGIWKDDFYQHRAGRTRPTHEHRQPPPGPAETRVSADEAIRQVVFRPAAELNSIATDNEN